MELAGIYLRLQTLNRIVRLRLALVDGRTFKIVTCIGDARDEKKRDVDQHPGDGFCAWANHLALYSPRPMPWPDKPFLDARSRYHCVLTFIVDVDAILVPQHLFSTC
jgi:hypothetical protein